MSKPAYRSYKPQTFGIDWQINFGKHKFERLGDVIKEDPGWVRWAESTVSWFTLDAEASKMLDTVEESGPYENHDPDSGPFFGCGDMEF